MRKGTLLLAAVAVLGLGLIATGCGGDDSTTANNVTVPTDITVPTDATDAIDKAPENIDQAVQQCLDNVDASNLPDDQKQSLKDLCQQGGDAANQALQNAQDQLGN